MSRLFAAFLLIAVLAIGGSAIAATAYQAGLTTAVAQISADGTTVVTPVVVPGYAYGFHPGFGFGFGFLGFLGTIFFLFLVFGLLRAIFGGGRHRHGWGPGGPGWGPGGPGGGRERFHGTFDEWHREAHVGQSASSGSADSTTTQPTPPTDPT